MTSPPRFVADFDSATGLVRALAAALHREPYRRLGRSRTAAHLVRASGLLPEQIRKQTFCRYGATEGVRPDQLVDVDPERFSSWVTERYGPRRCPAVAIGSSNGAIMHLCAAMGVPWLPQTFLVPVKRRGDPDDCRSDASLAATTSQRLLEREPGLQIHQMHDPNQDRLMVARIAYFRMKLRALTEAYRRYLRDTLVPGGTILVVDCTTAWPVTRRGERHVYQQGAVGGLDPEEYVDGSERVSRFLSEQRASVGTWDFPGVDDHSPEAEWGFEQALADDLAALASAEGYRLVRIRFPDPQSPSGLVADIYRDWFAGMGERPSRLVAETFICVEPTWMLATRSVPLWLTFGTEPSLATLDTYLAAADRPALAELLVTLFPHGVRSAGYAAAERWLEVGTERGMVTELAGVAARRWPADFASLVNYSDSLRRFGSPLPLPAPLPIEHVEQAVVAGGERYGVQWLAQ
ncbi:MAG TPA: hypothetical protein VG899_15470 [Mycobacteriales bacterium]|nr:hypothetical protein [Mycobacteriales bacterium]